METKWKASQKKALPIRKIFIENAQRNFFAQKFYLFKHWNHLKPFILDFGLFSARKHSMIKIFIELVFLKIFSFNLIYSYVPKTMQLNKIDLIIVLLEQISPSSFVSLCCFSFFSTEKLFHIFKVSSGYHVFFTLPEIRKNLLHLPPRREVNIEECLFFGGDNELKICWSAFFQEKATFFSLKKSQNLNSI